MNGITISKLCKDYHLGKTVVRALKSVDLDIKSGSFVCVAGPSGSGKTTLLNMIGLIDSPTGGTVQVAGEDIQALSEALRTRYRNRTLGFIFQSFNLLPVLDVYENIRLPLILHRELSKEEKHERVMELVSAVGLTDHLRHKPFELSGGQRQRVAIARALVTHPLIVLADEPTANLDAENSHHIMRTMVQLNQTLGATFVFATHDEKVISYLRRKITLVDGKIASDERR